MKERTICRGDLFYYDFENRTGSVQSGERPVLVIQADDYNKNAPTIIVAAVTSVIKKRYLPSHIYIYNGGGLRVDFQAADEYNKYQWRIAGFHSSTYIIYIKTYIIRVPNCCKRVRKSCF